MEVRRWDGPRVKQVRKVIVDRAKRRLVPDGVNLDRDRRSVTKTGGNGEDEYYLEPGLYRVPNAISTCRGTSDKCFRVEDDGSITDLVNIDKLVDAASADFPDTARAAQADIDEAEREEKRRQRIASAIAQERDYFEPIERDGYTARPEWNRLPPLFPHERSEDEVVARHVEPARWIVDEPFVKAETAEEAIDEAIEIERKRAADREEAERRAAEAGLPELTGSPKQVDWAQQIRARYVEKYGNDGTVKRAKRAKYWIDNYRKLTAGGR